MEPKAKFHTGAQHLSSFTSLNLQIETSELAVMGFDLSGERRILGEEIVRMDFNCDKKMLLNLIRAGN